MDLPDSRPTTIEHEFDLHQTPSKTQPKQKRREMVKTTTNSTRRCTNEKKTSKRVAI